MELKRVSAAEARRLVEEDGYRLIDVRSVPEFEDRRAEGAENVPFLHKTDQGMVPNPDFESVMQSVAPDKGTGLVTYCEMGGRSVRAAQSLVRLGYTNVIDILGGLSSEKEDSGRVVHEGWADSGLPMGSGPGGAKGYSELSQGVGAEAAPSVEEAAPPASDDPSMNRFASSKRKVNCIKFKRELPGLKRRPYPGELGLRLYEGVSALAWDEWVEHSKMIINEYRIVSTDPKAMEMLYEQCERFFFGEGVDRPAEYVPQSAD